MIPPRLATADVTPSAPLADLAFEGWQAEIQVTP